MIIGIVLAGLVSIYLGCGWYMTSEDLDEKYDSSNRRPQGLERVREVILLPGLAIIVLAIGLVIVAMVAMEFWPKEDDFMSIG